jgi:hypothetical protein
MKWSSRRVRFFWLTVGLSSLGGAIIAKGVDLGLGLYNAQRESKSERRAAAQRDSAATWARKAQGVELVIHLEPLLKQQSDTQQARTIRALGAIDATTAAIAAAVHPSQSASTALNGIAASGAVSPTDSGMLSRVAEALSTPMSQTHPAQIHALPQSLNGSPQHGPADLQFDAFVPPSRPGLDVPATPLQNRRGAAHLCGMWQDANGNLWCGGTCGPGQVCGRTTIG